MLRLLSLCLLVSLLIPIAYAEKVTLNQVPQNVYVSASFIEKEAYPEVVLNANPAYTALKDVVYLRFPAPDGIPMRFSQDIASFFMEDLYVEQSYQLHSSESFESFLKNAASKKMIVLDTADAAAYLDTKYVGNAYGLIAAPELGKNAKVFITMTFHNYYSNTISDKEIKIMTDAILSEITRIQSTMRYEKGLETYWTQDFYKGLNILSTHADLSVHFTFDALPFLGKNKEIEYAFPLLLSVENTKLKFVAITPSGKQTIEMDINTYSYVNSKKNSDSDSVFTVVLDDGYEYDIHGNLFKDTQYTSFNASRLLTDKTKDGRNLYLTWSVSGGGSINWYTREDIELLMNALVKLTSVETDLELMGYKGTEIEIEEDVPAAVESEVTESPVKAPSGIFSGFGKKDSNPDAWTCECGSENTSKFCPECGSKKPDYKCTGCDYVFEKDSSFKFCPECGAKR